VNNMCKEAVVAYFNAINNIVLGETRKKITKKKKNVLKYETIRV